jgi:hypothetical protein
VGRAFSHKDIGVCDPPVGAIALDPTATAHKSTAKNRNATAIAVVLKKAQNTVFLAVFDIFREVIE